MLSTASPSSSEAPRIEPVAMRLDAAPGRWQLTELQYVLAARLPDHGPDHGEVGT
jgi:hypothetical protein